MVVPRPSKPQAEAFGFPNPLLGIAGFAIVTTIGAALLAGASFRRLFWLGLQAGVTFGVVFVHWLIFQSLYRIQALCPYCMAVWAVTVPIFWYVTLHNLNRGHLPVPTGAQKAVAAATPVPHCCADDLDGCAAHTDRRAVLDVLETLP
ncbi:vitamin K epoxide reductase family protein [Kribbella orskensis]|uniref:Vitamin K epoxide reductase family protein n=1 Tax=Kribbella orskensis TaxID=2512216 RepID=A0ABY2B8B5_9ACTN|nr:MULTISPECIES: vitamin K epoxide reductase family protein [Kribbella]TCN30649.1 vitamin K epoxide reductase family protein [Kribbella sp. VKM Ac-2500]TCO11368.1 vitamin K epoxide reductase family protein [Kribbella orskensis]